ncbi:hypothetical protein [Enterobacter bugandensis]|uniref:hypothetical protein n=1 Tax=Enterobacter bugandensis TaxID=881260 RepID=UPI003704A75A
MLLLQNWTLSLIFSAGLVAFSHDFDNRFVTYLCWYLLTSVGMVVCRSLIRFGAGWLRNRGYNRRFVAVAGLTEDNRAGRAQLHRQGDAAQHWGNEQ